MFEYVEFLITDGCVMFSKNNSYQVISLLQRDKSQLYQIL